MQFSRFAVAVFAVAVTASELETVTDDVTSTIYSCAATVVDCPYRTHTSTSSYATAVPVVTSAGASVPAVTASSAPVIIAPSSMPVVYTNSTPSVTFVAPSAPVSVASAPIVTPAAPSVTLITSAVVPVASPSGIIATPSSNVTVPAATATPTAFLSGAGSISGSVFVAAAAGLAAFLFA